MRKVDPKKFEAQRRRIRAAARRCFRRSGFRGAGMADICAEAKMSPGNLYHYYDGKEAIIEAICEDHRRQVAGRLAAIAQGRDLFGAMLDYAGEAMSGKTNLDARRFTAEIHAEALRNRRVAAILRRHNAALRAACAEAIARAQAMGQADPALDPRHAAALLVGAADGLRFQLALDRSLDPKQSGQTFRTLVTRFLGRR